MYHDAEYEKPEAKHWKRRSKEGPIIQRFFIIGSLAAAGTYILLLF